MSKQQQQIEIKSQCSLSHQCSLQQSKQILQNQLQLIKEENDTLKRIQQTLKLALKQNKNVENNQNQEQTNYINKKPQLNIITSLFQRTQVSQTQLMSYKELYQIQLKKTSDLDMEIDRLQQKRKSEWRTRTQKYNSQKMKTQNYKNFDNQEFCSQFNAVEPIILSSYHNKTNIIQDKSKTSRSQSCQKMDKFMKTLQNNNRQRICSTKPSDHCILNLKTAQKRNKQLSILVDKNTQSFINIKISQNNLTRQPNKKQQNNIKNQREIVLKIINDDLVKLRI